MLPRLDQLPPTQQRYRDLSRALRAAGVTGEIRDDAATRLISGTDNSIYQLVPELVVYPRSHDDVRAALRTLSEPRFEGLTVAPRGGGTGTNGQSLGDGVVLDVSRHMDRVLDVDLERMTARVQPGVVLDQLNDQLAPHGVFFAPNLSPSSRATIGGMIATDACGKGSRVYGKTSEHLVSLKIVTLDGAEHDTAPVDAAGLAAHKRRDDMVGALYRAIDDVVTTHADTIAARFPRLRRFLTGYDLHHVKVGDRFDLARIIAGSEGSLAVVTEATIRLTPLPTVRQLVVLRFGSFEDALASATDVVARDPSAIETIDETVLGLARRDVIYDAVAAYVTAEGEPDPAAINLVEFEGTDADAVAAKVRDLTDAISARLGTPGAATGFTVAPDAGARAALWALRKKGVGLLGNMPGARKPVPFIEDTVVPPEHLAAYIAELRAVLDAEGLTYGMFGHVDVGCLHVRPALNMSDPDDEARVRRISDATVALVQKYGGLIWGEHGKGMRAEYSPRFFGETLYRAMGEIKAAADPAHRLNPRKIVPPTGRETELATIEAPTRGARDRQVPATVRAEFPVAIDCNGNGQCFDYHPDHVMCPSWKVTRDRVHSPKGRAGVFREWLRQLAAVGYAPTRKAPWGRARAALTWPVRAYHSAVRRIVGRYDYSHEVYDAMAGCLACKACATQCPIKVDVPDFRAEFLEQYHRRYTRPLKDYVVAALEGSVRAMALAPRAINFVVRRRLFGWLMARVVGIVDTPEVATESLSAGLKARGVRVIRASEAAGLDPERDVVVLQDAFTTYYEPRVVLALVDLLRALGREPVVARFFPNGKGLHVKGFLGRFERLARKNAATLRALAASGAPLVGVDPAVVLTYRDEYVRALGPDALRGVRVEMVQELLARIWPAGLTIPGGDAAGFALFGHCTEKTATTSSQRLWKAVFGAAGVPLELVDVGCCGMSGAYGHEASHRAESKGIFAMSWAPKVDAVGAARVVASGYSCRSQVKRLAGFVPPHPVEVLASKARSARVGAERTSQATGSP